MGLDQYLKATINLPDYEQLRDELKDENSERLSKARDTVNELVLQTEKTPEQGAFGVFTSPARIAVNINIAYWRKCNQIHDWFNRLSQQKVNHDLENCEELEVSLEDLQRLISECQMVLENHDLAEELLPTASGFFFGSTEYGDCYFGVLQDTIDQLKPIVEKAAEASHFWSFSYHGWW